MKRARLMGVLVAAWLALCGCAHAADSDLQRRFDMAAAAGVHFVLTDGAALPAAKLTPVKAWDINWGSAPDAIVALHFAAQPGDRVLLSNQRGEPLLVARAGGVLLTLETSGAVRRWPYFNYMLYCAACDAAGRRRQSFAAWPWSPVPHAGFRCFFAVCVAAGWMLFGMGWSLARRRGRASPHAARDFFGAVEAAARARAGDAVQWNRVGFARPLAGFLTLLGTMSFMVGAFFVIQWVLSKNVQPFPEADGLWRTAWDTLVIFSCIFECGTFVSMPKYFSEHRSSDPAQALADVQFYVWWAFFQRLCQATLLGVVAMGVVPHTSYAIYSVFVIIFAVKGMVSIYQLPKLLFTSLQRFDYNNLLDMAEQRVLVFLVPIPCVLLGRWWGAHHPQFGEAFGAAVGLGLGELMSQVSVLALGAWCLRRLEIPLRPLFLVQFDIATAKRQLGFGAKIALGIEPFNLLKSVEQVVIVLMMSDFTAWLGIYQLLSARVLMLCYFGMTFTNGAVASLSEAYAAGKKHLTQYYVARFFQFSSLFQFTIFSLLMALGPAFIRSLGPQWERAIPYMGIAVAQCLLWTPAWVSDQLQFGAGRAGTNLAVMCVEQGTRMLGFLFFVPRFHFAGLFMATTLGLVCKMAVAWVVNHKTIVPFRLGWWASWGAPAVAALVNYGIWYDVVSWLAPRNNAVVLVLMCVASALSFFITFFACAAAGGLDAEAQRELQQAAGMCTVARPLTRWLTASALAGARFCPWRVPSLDFAEAALAEAAELDSRGAAA